MMYIIRQEIMISNSAFKTVIAILSLNVVMSSENTNQAVNIAEIKSKTI